MNGLYIAIVFIFIFIFILKRKLMNFVNKRGRGKRMKLKNITSFNLYLQIYYLISKSGHLFKMKLYFLLIGTNLH